MHDEGGPGASRATLASVPLFASLNESELSALAFRAEERSYRDGDVIVAQGDPGNALYLILAGQGRVERAGRPVAVLGPGQYFGEMALLDPQPRTADVKATGPVRCLVLAGYDFWRAVESHPEVIQPMFKEIVRRLRSGPTALSE